MKTLLITLFTFTLFYTSHLYGQEMEAVTITVTPVNKNVYMLTGRGGNIGLCTGSDGNFIIDDQFAPLTQKIKDAVSTLSDQPIKFLVNTHYHGDHTGGNANFEKDGTLIVAHNNVRKRLLNNNKREGLPLITFSEDAIFHINNNDILITHVYHAHTDGDALVYFNQSNVLHTGDTFFNGRFPYIDLKSGGSIEGDIEAGKAGLMLINSDTKIIPGHGDLATYADYKKYVEMLEGIKNAIQEQINAGASRDAIIANESLTSMYYTDKEKEDDFISGPKFRETVYDSLMAKE